ncbi:MAG: hypothetical protein V1875_01075 [Candidatus Altiarchaeota archaeon]
MITTVDAVKVAVVADNGAGGISKNCYDADDGAGMDLLCDKSSYECSDFGFGKFVTAINGFECTYSTENPHWWALFKNGATSMVGISEIKAKGGLLIGWRCGFGEKPEGDLKFCDVCECAGGSSVDTRVFIPKIMRYAQDPEAVAPGDTVRFRFEDNKTDAPVRDATLEVYTGLVGVTMPMVSTKSNYTGEAELPFEKAGIYTVLVSGTDYPQAYITIDVSTTTTTSTSTTSSSTTTTYLPPPHFLDKTTTTSSTIGTTTSSTLPEPAVIGDAVAAEEPQGQGLFQWLMGLIGF